MDGVADRKGREGERLDEEKREPIRAYRFCSHNARCCGCACAWGSLVAAFTTGGSPCAILGTIRVSRGGRPRSEKPDFWRPKPSSNALKLDEA